MTKPKVNLVNLPEKHSGPSERVVEVVADGNTVHVLFYARPNGQLEVYPYSGTGDVRLTEPGPDSGIEVLR